MFDEDFLREQRVRAAVTFWLCLITITILSLVPGEQRPHSGMSGGLEHAAAYAGTGVFLILGHVTTRARIIAYAGVVALSFVFEFLQAYIPGRSSNILDALASDAGLTAGVVTGLCGVTWAARSQRE